MPMLDLKQKKKTVIFLCFIFHIAILEFIVIISHW